MDRRWRWFVPGYLWCLPLTIGYLLFVVLPFYRPRSLKFVQGVLTAVAGTKTVDGQLVTRIFGRPGGQTVGSFSIYVSEEVRSRGYMREHETTHVWQAFVLGIAFQILLPGLFWLLGWPVAVGVVLGGFVGAVVWGVTYVLFFLFFWIVSGFGPWHDAYARNPYEKHAYSIDSDDKAGWGTTDQDKIGR